MGEQSLFYLIDELDALWWGNPLLYSVGGIRVKSVNGLVV
jgi:hypothetical protein